MDADNLIRMANRIGEFFEAMPDREEALHGIADHIQKFWEPRMRGRILTVLAQPDEAAQLRPLVRDALQCHAAQLGKVRV
ncbi:MAG: formate dehydrogenase subunit delta [Comamonas sp.]|jgi:formate dehydrogenase subunit delta|uniref:formate dehydrogenase subunit delta n=1 Tax=Comamonas sp. TaxID=34028 RepID=UPI00281FFC82|nr:formate dehydrogenase subunit delta [Comamonas sp.]MDR0214661.1 formate dehydrogenase subunit delta [Comamonas sp.]